MGKLDESSYLFVIAITILLVGLVPFASTPGTTDTRFNTVVLSIAALAGIVIIVTFAAKFWKVEKRQDSQQSEIDAIRIALRGILTKHEFGPLKALSSLDEVKLHNNRNTIQYLHKLDGLEFIQPKPGQGLNKIEGLGYDEQFDLRNYYMITDAGRRFLEITASLNIFRHDAKWYDSRPFNDDIIRPREPK